MKKILITSLVCASLGLTQWASADILAQWSFDTLSVDSAPANTPSVNSIAADLGLGSASAYHANAASVWSTPVGNGSPKSLSANNWSVDDYFQFEASSIGYAGLVVSFDQTGSNTGPRDFGLQYSADGTTFLQFGTYTVINAGWNSSNPTVNPSSYSFDLSGITALDNATAIYFRLVNLGTTAINGNDVAAGGTGRVDNFTIATIPEPSSLTLVGGLGLLGLFFKRRHQK